MVNQVCWDKSREADGNFGSISQVYCNITSSVSDEIIFTVIFTAPALYMH